jgi:glutamate transport system permease protein
MTVSVLYDEPGPRGRRRIAVASAVAIVALVGVLAWIVWRLYDAGQFEGGRWSVIWDSREYLWGGLLITLRLAVTAIVLAIALGLVLGVGRTAQRAWIRWPVGAWVEFFRAVPLLALIIFAYIALPKYDIRLSPFWCVVAGLVLYNSAALGEIFKAGILTLDRGQREAAVSLGLRYWSTMRIVVLPQAIRRMLPACVSQIVTIVKDTSLGFVVSAEELLRRTRVIGEFNNAAVVTALIAAAVPYLVINVTLSYLGRRLERRQDRRGPRRGAARRPTSPVPAPAVALEVVE